MMSPTCSTTGNVNTLVVLKRYRLAPLAFFFSLFIYLTLGVLEQAAVMLEQTSKNRLAVNHNTNKGSSCH